MRTAPSLITGVVLGALVWAFAIIGVMSVASAAPDDPPASVAPLLPTGDVQGQDVMDIPRYPDARRIEYLRTRFRDVTQIGVAYLADAPVDDVRAFYRSQLGRHGWNVVDARLTRGEWTYFAENGTRIAHIEITPIEGFVEIEIEIDIPGMSRGTTTDR